MFSQRLRRWPNIKTTLDKRLVLRGIPYLQISYVHDKDADEYKETYWGHEERQDKIIEPVPKPSYVQQHLQLCDLCHEQDGDESGLGLVLVLLQIMVTLNNLWDRKDRMNCHELLSIF